MYRCIVISSFVIFLFLHITEPTFALPTESNNRWQDSLKHGENNLKKIAFDMINDSLTTDRLHDDSIFTRHFIQLLKYPYSFEYPFDSLTTLGRLYAPDSSFRIITWQIRLDINDTRHFGCIQMKTKDGHLKLFPLFDISADSIQPCTIIGDMNNWIGAVYYKIIKTVYMHKSYYTLIGFDDNNLITNRKWIEVLYFDTKGNPVFGGNFFNYPAGDGKPMPPVTRFMLAYKKNATLFMNYDPNLSKIVFDELVSESNQPFLAQTFVPDGNYEAFVWDHGQWVLTKDVLTPASKEAERAVPIPKPIQFIKKKRVAQQETQ
ncbi:MAG: hypothetical protein QM528_03430 [Phycisphaerales bacterium]|nr:hypothetical protein [Phycisphaerales bacterium]